MAQNSAAVGASPSSGRRRAWRNRRPVALRLVLTPEQREAKEAQQQAERRTAFIGFQVTPGERKVIEDRAKASGNRLSDFARIVLLSDLKAPAPPAIDAEAILALSFQLSKIGTNLNQLAKHANETRSLPHLDELKAVTSQIVTVLNQVIPA